MLLIKFCSWDSLTLFNSFSNKLKLSLFSERSYLNLSFSVLKDSIKLFLSSKSCLHLPISTFNVEISSRLLFFSSFNNSMISLNEPISDL